MRRKIIGVTVDTPINPKKIEDKIKPVKTVNGKTPDKNGNVEVVGDKGDAGKSAYQYAQEGGYLGTEAEFAEKFAFLMGYSVFGYVDENMDIILKGNITNGAYLKLEMEDGSLITVGQAVFVPKPTYTNLADPTSADWIVGKRFNSAGELVDVDSGVKGATTNYIGGDLVAGDIIRVKNMDLTTYRVAVYDSAKTFKITTPLNNSALASYVSNVSVNSSEATFTINADTHLTNGGYIRFCGPLTGTSDDVIITKNEPIA